MYNHTILPNFHVLIVRYLGYTNTRSSRIKIISERFHQQVTIPYDDDNGTTLDQAEEWLLQRGHNVIGHAEGKNCYYVICGNIDGFQPLMLKEKPKNMRKYFYKIYNEQGISGVYTYASELGLSITPCIPCDTDTPTIETKDGKECAVCGQTKKK